MIESLVVATLRADPGVSALVAARVYPLLLPQAPTLPAVVYQRISHTPDPLLDGPGSPEDYRVQIDCYDVTFDGSRALGDAVRAALDGKDLLDVSKNLWLVPSLDSDRDIVEELQEGKNLARLNRFSMDFVISAAEAAA